MPITIDNNIDVLLKIWDTAGQERYMTLTKQYFYSLDGLLMVYDPACRETFEKVEFWLNQIKETINIDSIVIFLVENIQSIKNTKCTSEEGKQLADKFNLKFYSVNSNNGMNIDQCFRDLAQAIYNKMKNRVKTNNNIQVNKPKEKCIIF